jgi:type II restriction enzyme
VNLELSVAMAGRYRSGPQRTRVITESWAASNLYCAACDNTQLKSLRAGTPAADFVCAACGSVFELKSQSRRLGGKVSDAAYSAMRAAILDDRTPNFYFLHYDAPSWRVCNLLLVPRFAFSMASIEKRKPLSERAEQAGWVGCNILLGEIPADARIQVVTDGIAARQDDVRAAYERLRPLAELDIEKRGWTLDVLNVVRSLRRTEFSLADVYASSDTLARLHPKNRHVRDKVRQQLQVLRDMGLIKFLGRGVYRLP